MVAGQREAFRPGCRGLDGEPCEAQRGGDEFTNRLLVFDDENSLFTRLPARTSLVRPGWRIGVQSVACVPTRPDREEILIC
jgi:hypothetical protein